MENLLMFLPFLFFLGTTLYGANQTKARDPSGANIADPGVLGGNVKCMIDYYEMLGTEVALDVIEMGKKLPKGARVLDIDVLTEDLADTCTIHVGDYEDTDRYMQSISCQAAARFRNLETLTEDSLGYECDESVSTTLDTQIIMTFATLVATLNVGARITIVIRYTHE